MHHNNDLPALELIEAKEKEKPSIPGITIHRSDELFIALATNAAMHSFVFLGVIQNQKPLFLARIGKSNNIDPDSDSSCKLGVKAIFSTTKAQLQSESLGFHDPVKNYIAYTITYQQYLNFIQLLRLASTHRSIACFLPDGEENTDTITLKKFSIKNSSSKPDHPQEENILKRSRYLNASNTCRDTAVDLIQYTQNIDHLPDNVSRIFFRDLPLKIHFTNGKPDDHFYVFPLPPNAYSLDKKKSAILTTLYKRMENLLQKDPYSEVTIAKFNALKTLYLSQARILKEDSFQAALDNIRAWKSENKNVIETLRAQSFFGKLFTRQSSTVAMTNQLISALEQTAKLKTAS